MRRARTASSVRCSRTCRARTRARPVASPRRHGHEWGGFLQVNLLLVAIWAVSGAGYFWPAWVMLWWGFALVMKSGPRLLRLR